MLITALLILIALTYINYSTTKNILHPAVIYAGIWSIQLIALQFINKFIELSMYALLVVVLGAIMFSFGSYLSFITTYNWNREIIRPRLITRSIIKYGCMALITITCLYWQHKIYNDNSVGGDDIATNLVYIRTLTSIENVDIFGIYKYGGIFAQSSLVLLLILILKGKATLLHKILFFYFLFAALYMAYLSTGRGPIALILLQLSIIYSLISGVNWKFFIGMTVLFITTFIIFWVMGSLMGKADDNAANAIFELQDYLFSSIPALSVYIDQHPLNLIDGDWGINIFRFFIALMGAIGFADKPDNLVQEFVSVPHLTNLFTLYLHYIKDFGLAGVIVIPILLGFFHDQIFKWYMSNKNNDFALFILSISYLPLLQSIFQELYFLSLSAWLQYILLGLIMCNSYKNNGEIKNVQ